MCIVANTVDDVKATKIACFQVKCLIDGVENDYLLTIYNAIIMTQNSSNALILPVYNPTNNVHNIIPLDMSDNEFIFQEMRGYFDKNYGRATKGVLPNANNSHVSIDLLKVFNVGNYKFSIMSNKNDFNRINKQELNIADEARTSINAHNMNYSFIVYQFTGSGYIEPFA